MFVFVLCLWGVVVFPHALHNSYNNKRQWWPIIVCSPKPHTPPTTPPPFPPAAAAHTLPVSRTPFARPALPTIYTPPLHRSTNVLHQSTINTHNHCPLPPHPAVLASTRKKGPTVTRPRLPKSISKMSQPRTCTRHGRSISRAG